MKGLDTSGYWNGMLMCHLRDPQHKLIQHSVWYRVYHILDPGNEAKVGAAIIIKGTFTHLQEMGYQTKQI